MKSLEKKPIRLLVAIDVSAAELVVVSAPQDGCHGARTVYANTPAGYRLIIKRLPPKESLRA